MHTLVPNDFVGKNFDAGISISIESPISVSKIASKPIVAHFENIFDANKNLHLEIK